MSSPKNTHPHMQSHAPPDPGLDTDLDGQRDSLERILRDSSCDSSDRIQWSRGLHRILGRVHPKSTADPVSTAERVRLCRQRLEDARVRMHPEMAILPLSIDRGITEDSIHFRVVLACVAAEGRLLADRGTPPGSTGSPSALGFPEDLHRAWEVFVSGPPGGEAKCADIGPPESREGRCPTCGIDRRPGPGGVLCSEQVRYEMAAVLQHRRALLCAAGRERRGSVCAVVDRLTRAAAHLVVCRAADFPEKLTDRWVVEWAAWTAAVKREVVEQVYLASRARSEPPSVRVRPHEAAIGGARCCTREEFVEWARESMGEWIRIKDALGRAYLRRITRYDETTCIAAFNGKRDTRRSRGMVDSIGDYCTGIDPELLLAQPSDCPTPTLDMRELLLLRLFHNALESNTQCSFLTEHLVLDNRSVDSDTTDPTRHSWVVAEMLGGWVVRPPLKPSETYRRHTSEGPMVLEDALIHFYCGRFPYPEDPLGLWVPVDREENEEEEEEEENDEEL